MKVFIIWLFGVVLWNFGYPSASPLEDVIAAIVLSFLSLGLKKITIQKKNKYFGNKK